MTRMAAPEPEPSAARSSRRGPAREYAILDAAIALIAEVGYERITVDAIAARAHASKTTMYRRWTGKAELVADALRHQAKSAAPAVPDTGSLREDLLLVVGQIADTLTGRAGPSLIGLLEAIRDDRVLRELIGSQIRDRSHEVGRAVCGRAVLRGDAIREDHAEAMLDVAFSHVFTQTLFNGHVPDQVTRESLVDDILLRLLCC
jgi:AcrR family transcriptional regulator